MREENEEEATRAARKLDPYRRVVATAQFKAELLQGGVYTQIKET